MNISPKHLYIGLALFAAILVGTLAGAAYIATKMDIVRFKQVVEDQKPIHQEAKQDVAQGTRDAVAAQKSESANQQALAVALVAIANQKNQPIASQVDYERIQKMIEQTVGSKVEVKATELPNAPSVTMSAPNFIAYKADCDSAKAEYGSCKTSLFNKQAELDATERKYKGEVKDHAATQKELDSAKRAMHGGGFWSRLKSNSKWLVIGVGAGAAAVCGSGHCR